MTGYLMITAVALAAVWRWMLYLRDRNDRASLTRVEHLRRFLRDHQAETLRRRRLEEAERWGRFRG